MPEPEFQSGFPWEAIVLGTTVAVAILLMVRRLHRNLGGHSQVPSQSRLSACATGSCLVADSLQKRYYLSAFPSEFYFRDRGFHRAKVIHDDSLLFAVDDGIDPTAFRSVFVDFAAAFRSVVENAESAAISQFGEAVLVITREFLSVVSRLLQTFSVGGGKHHFRFFTADSAMRTTHEQGLLQLPFTGFCQSPFRLGVSPLIDGNSYPTDLDVMISALT